MDRMDRSYQPLATSEPLAERDVDDGLFATAFDQYQSSPSSRLQESSRRGSARSSTTSVAFGQDQGQGRGSGSGHGAPSGALASDNETVAADSTFSLLDIPTLEITDRDREINETPTRSPSPFPFERCVTPATVQELLQQNATIDYTLAGGGLWREAGEGDEMRPISCWQRSRRPLARAVGIVTAVMLSGCAGEMFALGATWRGAGAATGAGGALLLDCLWAIEALSAVALGGRPPESLHLIRRAARRTRTPFYAIVALLLLIEGVGALRWAAAALAVLSAAMRAAAWCCPRPPRAAPLLPRSHSFNAPMIRYDADYCQRVEGGPYSLGPPVLRIPLHSQPGTPIPSRPTAAYPRAPTTPLASRPGTPLQPRPHPKSPAASRPGTPCDVAFRLAPPSPPSPPSPPPLLQL